MAFEGVGDADDAAFGDGGVGGDGLFDGAGAEAVGGDVDDVVGAGHDGDVTVFVNHARVAGIDPISVEAFQVAFVEAFFVIEESGEACGCERDGEHDIAHFAPLEFVAGVVYDSDVEAGHWLACCAGLDG